MLAMERGESGRRRQLGDGEDREGRLLREKRSKVILQGFATRGPSCRCSGAGELGDNAEAKQLSDFNANTGAIGRSFFVRTGVPRPIVKVLRDGLHWR